MKNLIRNITSWHKGGSSSVKPTAILHIGVEKTGTSTIQEFLHLNRKILADQGVCYPSFLNPRNHLQLAVFCCDDHKSNQFTRVNDIDDTGKRKNWKMDFMDLFDKEMRKITGNYDSVIFSSEHLSILLREENEIQCLQKTLEPFVSSFTIIIYIRRQDLIAGSMISNAAKAGIGKTSPKGNEIFKRHFYNFDRLLKKWSSIFGERNIRLRILEKAHLMGEDLIEDFMKQAGLSHNFEYKIPGRLNKSLSATAVEAAWFFNKKFPVDNNRIDINTLRDLRLKLINKMNRDYPGSGKMLQKENAVKFLKHYEASNKKVARTWFKREQLFSDDFSMYPDAEQKVDQELVKNLVEDFIAKNNLTPAHE